MPRSDILVKFYLGKEDHAELKSMMHSGETWEVFVLRLAECVRKYMESEK